MDRAYELFKYDGRRWRLVEQFPFSEKARAYRSATELQAQPDCEGVRLVSERYDPATGESLQVIAIDTGPKDTVGPGQGYGGDELFEQPPAAPWRAVLERTPPPHRRPAAPRKARNESSARLGSTFTKFAVVALFGAIAAAIGGHIVHVALGLPTGLAVMVAFTVLVGVIALGIGTLARGGDWQRLRRAFAADGAGGRDDEAPAAAGPDGADAMPESLDAVAMRLLRGSLEGVDVPPALLSGVPFGAFIFMVGACEALVSKLGRGAPEAARLLQVCAEALAPGQGLSARFRKEGPAQMANPRTLDLIRAGRAAAGDLLTGAPPRNHLQVPLMAWLGTVAGPAGPQRVRAALWTDTGAQVERQRGSIDPAAQAMVQFHERIARQALEQNAAIGLRGGGSDGVGALFASTEAAVAAARALRTAMVVDDGRGVGRGMPIRIGLVDGDLGMGDVPHIEALVQDAVEVCRLGQPGDVLVTAQVVGGEVTAQTVSEIGTRVIGPLARPLALFRWLDQANAKPPASKSSAAA